MNLYYQQQQTKTPQLIATICIYGHGRTDSVIISPDTANTTFHNTRLYTLGSKCGGVPGTAYMETGTLGYLKRVFQTDLVEKNTLDVIRKYQDDSTPKYLEYFPGEKKTDIGQVYDPITFDKIIGNDISVRERWYMGIYLVSIHEKKDGMLKLIYPDKKDMIDLFNLNDITNLVGYLNTYFENNHIQDPVPELINNAKSTFTDIDTESWTDKKKRFIDSRTSLYYIKDKYIHLIRMSALVALLKGILGVNANINIMDYTCNNFIIGTSTVEENQILVYKNPADIESGENKSFGGKKRKQTRKKQRNNKPNHYRNKRCRKTKNLKRKTRKSRK